MLKGIWATFRVRQTSAGTFSSHAIRLAALAATLLLASCAQRGTITVFPAAADISPPLKIYVGSTRTPDDELDEQTNPRSDQLHFARYDVSVPPDREPGEISFPKRYSPPDPTTDFLVSTEMHYATVTGFRSEIGQALARNGREAVVFVHGYNNTLAEGLYRFAQLGHDLRIPGVLVHYSWPSRANVLAYAYDRDSVLFARDGFEKLLGDLSAAGAERIIIVAHSMGSELVMETLRQMAIGANTNVMRRVAGVVLISPDLDVDVFRSEAARIGTLPQPFVIFTSRRDRVLALGALLSGESERLGNLQDTASLESLDLTVVDVSAVSEGTGHFVPGTSAALLTLFGQESRLLDALASDQSGRTGLVSYLVLSAQGATRIVLAPAMAATAP